MPIRRGLKEARPIIDVETELYRAGLDIVSRRGEWVDLLCPFHEDRRPSLSVNLDTGWWLCRAGCGQGWIEALTGNQPEELTEPSDELIMRLLEPQKERARRPLVLVPYTHGMAPRYLLDRKFTVDTLREWDIGWRVETKEIVVPVVERGVVIGHINRPLVYTGNGSKYTNSDGFHKSEHLFGLDRSLGHGSSEVVVVEGPLDCIWLHQCSVPSVAILGADLSDEQEHLLALHFWSVTTCFDNDDTGRGVTMDVTTRLLRRGLHVKHAILPPGRKDVQECTLEETLGAIRDAREVVSNASI